LNELVVIVIHLAQKPKHITNMFAIHPFFNFIFPTIEMTFCEVKACRMKYVNNCDMVYNVLLGDIPELYKYFWIWNGSYSDHITTILEFNALSFVFVICHECC
jgi:hypothetical protein